MRPSNSQAQLRTMDPSFSSSSKAEARHKKENRSESSAASPNDAANANASNAKSSNAKSSNATEISMGKENNHNSKTKMPMPMRSRSRSHSFEMTSLASHASFKIPRGSETDISKRISQSRQRQSRDRSAKSVLHFSNSALATSQQHHYRHQHHFDFDDDDESHKGRDTCSDSDSDSDSAAENDDEIESHQGKIDGEILKLLELLEIEEGIREELSWAASNDRIVDDNDDYIDDFIASHNGDDDGNYDWYGGPSSEMDGEGEADADANIDPSHLDRNSRSHLTQDSFGKTNNPLIKKYLRGDSFGSTNREMN